MASLTASALSASTFVGAAFPTLPAKEAVARRTVKITASSKKTVTKTPYGLGGGATFKVDASGNPVKGKGVYQFVKKYGANVDGYSPIYNRDEWSLKGSTYEGGAAGLALWAVTFGALLLVGVLLVYNTSALV
eukprot:TRINITY_DN140_c0_g1_i1.p1 TRINITY_DN140_c0_g1~~TRINITY_DN140_c0_g1_i1.p1  ORF type:complete len:152 (-),score=31.44 TRINITY_DN140_c0_g1_i1:102-500(-)